MGGEVAASVNAQCGLRTILPRVKVPEGMHCEHEQSFVSAAALQEADTLHVRNSNLLVMVRRPCTSKLLSLQVPESGSAQPQHLLSTPLRDAYAQKPVSAHMYS